MKQCIKCGGTDRYTDGECKQCCRERSKKYVENLRANHPERWAQMNKVNGANYYAKNKSRRAELNLKKYGISLKEWDAMFMSQSGCCAICNKHQSNFKYRLAVDHCHKTGKIRGLLCQNCNTAIGLLQDDPSLCVKAEKYLLKSRDTDA